jgi:saccharopine dehydrogenase-like NADP-dependent oxidoreductase
MNGTDDSRQSSVIREEISDLSTYLNNLPEATRSSGAFESYELRLIQLHEELSLRLVEDLSSFLQLDRDVEHEKTDIQDTDNKFVFISQLIRKRKEYHTNLASKFEQQSNYFQYSTFGAATASVASVASASSLSLLAAAGTAALAGLYPMFRLTPKLRLEQKLAEDLEWMESELSKLENKKYTIEYENILIEHLSERTETLVHRYETLSSEG